MSCENSPVRLSREAIIAGLAPLQIDSYDVLPDQVSPPAVAVGLPSLGPSRYESTTVFAFEVTLVGERADFASAQRRLDDLTWEAYELLQKTEGVGNVVFEPRSVTIAGQDHPGIVFTLESLLPC